MWAVVGSGSREKRVGTLFEQSDDQYRQGNQDPQRLAAILRHGTALVVEFIAQLRQSASGSRDGDCVDQERHVIQSQQNEIDAEEDRAR